MATIFAIAFIIIAVGGAIFYLIRAKKQGRKCIGCPYEKNCSSKCNGKKR